MGYGYSSVVDWWFLGMIFIIYYIVLICFLKVKMYELGFYLVFCEESFNDIKDVLGILLYEMLFGCIFFKGGNW